MTKVIVAMSGGVDSSVAALLLKKENFEVSGIFMKLFNFPRFREAEKSAKKIAKILKIPLIVVDFQKEFKKKVIDYFLREYKRGLTPNPCVVCNKKIKFGLLLKKAKNLGADFLATGHYAKKSKIKKDPIGSRKRQQKSEIIYKLLKGKDKTKDQSYFLWQINQKQLRHILFPVGRYTKEEVKKLAKSSGILELIRQESQDICFMTSTNFDEFLKSLIKTNKGKIITKKGEIIGEHQGLFFYTIGQRKGVKLPKGPYYVLNKDFKKNILVVTKNQKDLNRKELIVKNVNWISDKVPKFPLKIRAKIRYGHKLASAAIYKIQDTCLPAGRARYKIQFKRPQRAITPGQSVVFYKGNELLGGGIIC